MEAVQIFWTTSGARHPVEDDWSVVGVVSSGADTALGGLLRDWSMLIAVSTKTPIAIITGQLTVSGFFIFD